jgi:hypothetical protein
LLIWLNKWKQYLCRIHNEKYVLNKKVLAVAYEHSETDKSHGLVVKADGSWSRGRGLETGTVNWMDVSDASYYIHENNENKGSQMGHTQKNI